MPHDVIAIVTTDDKVIHPHNVIFTFNVDAAFASPLMWWSCIGVTLGFELMALLAIVELFGTYFIHQGAFLFALVILGFVTLVVWMALLIYQIRAAEKARLPFSWRYRWELIETLLVALVLWAVGTGGIWAWMDTFNISAKTRFPVEDFPGSAEWFVWRDVLLYYVLVAALLLYAYVRALVTMYFPEKSRIIDVAIDDDDADADDE